MICRFLIFRFFHSLLVFHFCFCNARSSCWRCSTSFCCYSFCYCHRSNKGSFTKGVLPKERHVVLGPKKAPKRLAIAFVVQRDHLLLMTLVLFRKFYKLDNQAKHLVMVVNSKINDVILSFLSTINNQKLFMVEN